MNAYEKIYSLLIEETVTVKTKEKPTQLASKRPKQKRGRLGVLRARAGDAGEKAGKAVAGGEMDVRQAVDDIGTHELATAHHGGGTTRTRRRYIKGMKSGARKK